MLRVAREHLLDEEKDHGPDHGAHEGTDAAHDYHHESLAGEDPEHDLGRGEAPEGREERAGEAREHGGDDEDHELEGPRVSSQAREAPLVLANGLEGMPEGRAH